VTKHQRLVLIISVLASFVAFLDSSVVNVALPAISRDLGGGLFTQQWVVDAYLITLGSLILLAGSLSDLFGRQRIIIIGLLSFGIVSILCSIAPSNVFLIIMRALQGVSGALLVPSSLALIMSSFSGKEQGKAIGSWTAWTGISFIIGPLLGGFLVDSVSWRLVFAINVIPIGICLFLLSKLDTPKEKTQEVKLDIIGALLCSLGLTSPLILICLIAGILSLISFVFYEARIANAMLPLNLFRVRNFSAGNLATLCIYGGLSIATFLIVIYLQQVSKYSAFGAGLSLLPITIIMFIMSPRFGALAGKYGPRTFMTVGPLLAGVGFLLMLRVNQHLSYFGQLFPGLIVFAFGLATTVAPLTTAVLRDIEPVHSGIASAVNNAVARIAGLITIALVGVIIGTHLNLAGFKRAILVTAILVMIGGVVSWVGIRNNPA
jgi:EmrB/QacA subfamily drug resistance transporter